MYTDEDSFLKNEDRTFFILYFSVKLGFVFQVTAIIEAQLTCLDVQMTFAPPEVTRAARTKLLEETLKWLAAREEAIIQPGFADCYAKNVVQVLIKPDSVMLPERERNSRSAR